MVALRVVALGLDLIFALYYCRKQNVCLVILYCTLALIMSR